MKQIKKYLLTSVIALGVFSSYSQAIPIVGPNGETKDATVNYTEFNSVSRVTSQPEAKKSRRSRVASSNAAVINTIKGPNYGPTRADETLWNISTRIRPDKSVSIAQVAFATFALNYHTFDDNNIHKLRPSSNLIVPTLSQIQSVTNAESLARLKVDEGRVTGTIPRQIKGAPVPRIQLPDSEPVVSDTMVLENKVSENTVSTNSVSETMLSEKMVEKTDLPASDKTNTTTPAVVSDVIPVATPTVVTTDTTNDKVIDNKPVETPVTPLIPIKTETVPTLQNNMPSGADVASKEMDSAKEMMPKEAVTPNTATSTETAPAPFTSETKSVSEAMKSLDEMMPAASEAESAMPTHLMPVSAIKVDDEVQRKLEQATKENDSLQLEIAKLREEARKKEEEDAKKHKELAAQLELAQEAEQAKQLEEESSIFEEILNNPLYLGGLIGSGVLLLGSLLFALFRRRRNKKELSFDDSDDLSDFEADDIEPDLDIGGSDFELDLDSDFNQLDELSSGSKSLTEAEELKLFNDANNNLSMNDLSFDDDDDDGEILDLALNDDEKLEIDLTDDELSVNESPFDHDLSFDEDQSDHTDTDLEKKNDEKSLDLSAEIEPQSDVLESDSISNNDANENNDIKSENVSLDEPLPFSFDDEDLTEIAEPVVSDSLSFESESEEPVTISENSDSDSDSESFSFDDEELPEIAQPAVSDLTEPFSGALAFETEEPIAIDEQSPQESISELLESDDLSDFFDSSQEEDIDETPEPLDQEERSDFDEAIFGESDLLHSSFFDDAKENVPTVDPERLSSEEREHLFGESDNTLLNSKAPMSLAEFEKSIEDQSGTLDTNYNDLLSEQNEENKPHFNIEELPIFDEAIATEALNAEENGTYDIDDDAEYIPNQNDLAHPKNEDYQQVSEDVQQQLNYLESKMNGLEEKVSIPNLATDLDTNLDIKEFLSEHSLNDTILNEMMLDDIDQEDPSGDWKDYSGSTIDAAEQDWDASQQIADESDSFNDIKKLFDEPLPEVISELIPNDKPVEQTSNSNYHNDVIDIESLMSEDDDVVDLNDSNQNQR